MFRRWLLPLTLLCGLLIAPLAMAAERAAPPEAGRTTSHCAGRDDAPQRHAPTKHFHCMGACFGVQPDLAAVPARPARLPAIVTRAAIDTLVGVVIAHDPPPPRHA